MNLGFVVTSSLNRQYVKEIAYLRNSATEMKLIKLIEKGLF